MILSQETIDKISIIGSTGLITILSSILSIVLSNRYAKRNFQLQHDLTMEIEKQKLMLQKLEKAYTLFRNWKVLNDSTYMQYTHFMDGKLSYDDVLELAIQQANEYKVDYSELEMIIRIYFPELVPGFDLVHKSKEIANQYVLLVRRTHSTRSTFKDEIKPFLQAQVNFDDVAEKFQDEIAAIGNANHHKQQGTESQLRSDK